MLGAITDVPPSILLPLNAATPPGNGGSLAAAVGQRQSDRPNCYRAVRRPPPPRPHESGIPWTARLVIDPLVLGKHTHRSSPIRHLALSGRLDPKSRSHLAMKSMFKRSFKILK